MTFRIKTAVVNTQDNTTPVKPRILTQADIDIIEEKYKDKESKIKREQCPEPTFVDYKKSLVKEPVFEKQTITYDKITNKWKIVKEAA
jgi:hypothetical protein